MARRKGQTYTPEQKAQKDYDDNALGFCVLCILCVGIMLVSSRWTFFSKRET